MLDQLFLFVCVTPCVSTVVVDLFHVALCEITCPKAVLPERIIANHTNAYTHKMYTSGPQAHLLHKLGGKKDLYVSESLDRVLHH